MQKGSVGKTPSGFRSVEAHAGRGMEFAAFVNGIEEEVVTEKVVLSGSAIDRRPRGTVGRIRQNHLSEWLQETGRDDGWLRVGEGVIVDLGEDNYICGPNGGLLWERPKSER